MNALVPLLSTHSSIMPEHERMQRIGAWVCRLAIAAPVTPTPKSAHDESADTKQFSGDASVRIMSYLRRRIEASPLEIRHSVGLSRSMTYRTLQVLHGSGLVTSVGKTKNLVYRAAQADPMRN